VRATSWNRLTANDTRLVKQSVTATMGCDSRAQRTVKHRVSASCVSPRWANRTRVPRGRLFEPTRKCCADEGATRVNHEAAFQGAPPAIPRLPSGLSCTPNATHRISPVFRALACNHWHPCPARRIPPGSADSRPEPGHGKTDRGALARWEICQGVEGGRDCRRRRIVTSLGIVSWGIIGPSILTDVSESVSLGDPL
jgi:hypothetical protein